MSSRSGNSSDVVRVFAWSSRSGRCGEQKQVKEKRDACGAVKHDRLSFRYRRNIDRYRSSRYKRRERDACGAVQHYSLCAVVQYENTENPVAKAGGQSDG